MLYITNNCRIRRYDKRNLIVEEFVAVKPKDPDAEIKYKWQGLGYFGNLAGALSHVINQEFMDHLGIVDEDEINKKEIQDLIESLKNIKAELLKELPLKITANIDELAEEEED